MKALWKLLIAVILSIGGVAATQQTPAAALSSWDVHFVNCSTHCQGGQYVAHSSAGAVQAFAVVVKCSDGYWRMGNRVYDPWVASLYFCPGGLWAVAITADFYY